MKTGNVLLLAGGAYLLYEAFQKATFANTVNIVFQGVSIQNLNSIICHFLVQNITSDQVTIESMTGQLLLNGNEFAGLSKFDPTTVMGNSETPLDIKVSPDFMGVFSNFSQLISSPGTPLNFTATGNVNIDGLPIFAFDLSKTVTI